MKKFYIFSVLLLMIAMVGKTYSQAGSQIFTSSGVFTVPADVTILTIELVGTGGEGGVNGGGGGGGGGYAKGVYSVVPLTDYTVTVGIAGGGASGGTTSVGDLISATGGENGTWVPNPNLGGGGAGGVGSNGTIANRIGGTGGGGFWTYFGGGGGGAAGSVSDGFAGGNTITWTGNCQTPGGAAGLSGGAPGGDGGKGAGFTDVNCNVTDPAGNGENYGGGGGGGNGNGGVQGTGIGGYVFISWGNTTENCCDYSNNGQNIGIEGESFGVGLGDLDGDGDQDAVKIDAYNDIEVYENNGNAEFTLMQNVGLDGWRYGVKIIDVDLDDDLDIVTAGFGLNYGCEVYKNNGSGNFSLTQDDIATNLTINKFDMADLNEDGYPDLFLPAYSGGGSQVWFNNGTGHFTNSNQNLTGQSCTEVALGDLDGDGDTDAFVSCTNFAPSMVWLNDGSGNFTDSGQTLGTGNSYGVDMGDVDNDGDNDVVCANWTVPSQVWLNDGDGNFTEGFVIDNNNYAKSVKLVDHDYDHWVDVFLGSYGSNGLQVWHNIGGGIFELCFENEGDVYAHDLAVGDLNNDLMPDVYLGNFSSSDGDQVYIKATTIIMEESASVCQGDSLYVGGGWQHTTGNYIDALNCDTIIRTVLTVIVVDTSVIMTGSTLTALAPDASYQWLDCSTWLPVEGATSQSFTPDETGFYAVEVTQQNCADTSGCYFVDLTGLNDFAEVEHFHIYPNPAGNKLFIESEDFNGLMEISITDIMGLEVINQNSVPTGSLELNVTELKNGCYFLHIQCERSTITRKVLIYR
jgi:hypothetical protein